MIKRPIFAPRINIGQRGPAGSATGPGTSVAGDIVVFADTAGQNLSDSGKTLSTDGTFASNSDLKVPTEKAVQTKLTAQKDVSETLTGKTLTSPVLNTGVSGSAIDTDGTLAANSDVKLASQKAVKTYADTLKISPQNLLKNGNFINNSTNGYGATPDDWTSSNANPVQGGIPALTKQNLIDGLGIADGDIEGLWPLNEASGNALDLSSNAYNLTDTNTVGVSSDGMLASARDFEFANSEYFTIADASAPNLEIAGSQTWFAFVKPETASTAGHCFLGKSNATTYKLLQIQTNGISQAGVGFQLSGLTTNTIVISDVSLEAGKWYFVCGVYDSANSKLKVWVNGIKKEVTASGSSTDTNGTFNLGRTGGTSPNYYDGLIQNACVLSVALTDNQVKKLFAMTMYKGQKIRRATTDAYQYQQLPQNIVEKLRGKTVALRSDLYQDTASTAQISIHQTMADATTDETIISATDATTGSWLSKVATGTLEADVVTVEIRIKHSTTDGNSWFRNISLYEGSALLPYDHSKEDWSRFPRLLKMDIPAVISGYQFEEGRWFSNTPTFTGYSSAVTSVSRFCIIGKSVLYSLYISAGTSNSADLTLTAPVKAANTGTYYFSSATITDNAVIQSVPGRFYIASNSVIISLGKTMAADAGFTASGNKLCVGQLSYEID